VAQMGLFDIGSVIFNPIQSVMESVFPALISLSVWAVLAAFLSMWVYGKSSNQSVLSQIKPLQKAASKRLAVYDGPFGGLMPLIRENLILSGKHMWLTLFPALLATLPLLFILPWLSNTFGVYFPEPGTPVAIQVESYTPYELHWDSDNTFAGTGTGRWEIEWPGAASKLKLLGGDDKPVLTLPPNLASGILHKKQWWNILLANPPGYIEPKSIVETAYLDLPERELLPFGPDWMRGWLPLFMLYLFSFSMFFKWRWRLR
jgi:hypothetical protein